MKGGSGEAETEGVASTKLEDPENPISPFLIRYAHDGFFLTPGDELTQVWTFFRQI